jgi:hypothetical protein
MAGMRAVVLILAGLMAIAAAPPPPEALQPYIRDGHFNPGDYRWMRGRFEDASDRERADTAAIRAWLDACFAADQAQSRAELRTLGISDPKLDQGSFREVLCAEVASAPYPLQATTVASFQQAAATATPIADAFLAAVLLAEEMGGPRADTLAARLMARPLGEQMLRTALNWDGVEGAPQLAPDVKAVVISRISAAIAERDRANTEYLERIVAEHGWPRISEVGEAASQNAWLLVQHADANPAFQLRALRLMEPLLASGEVSRRNYVYLYDRVMLKITGRQRYGTQATCRAGALVPQPLEDENAVARFRAEAGLEPIGEYLTQLRASAGPCPVEPPARPR